MLKKRFKDRSYHRRLSVSLECQEIFKHHIGYGLCCIPERIDEVGIA